MQRTEPDGIVISCDFCGTDWDQVRPMIEGHQGSVLCLECLKIALREKKAGEGKYRCTLCLRENISADLPRWTGSRVEATACQDCIFQAARAFSRDRDTDFTWSGPNASN